MPLRFLPPMVVSIGKNQKKDSYADPRYQKNSSPKKEEVFFGKRSGKDL